MSYSPRQQAMLREMGVQVWLPSANEVAEPAGLIESATEAMPVPALPLATPAATPFAPVVKTVAAAVAVVEAPKSPLGSLTDLDWPALREAVANCRACTLCENRKQTVFGVGHHQAQWMVVGEAPGEQEDQQGEPFVGAAGQLLDNMLRALNLTRANDGPQPPAQRVYIANTLKCRPPRNRIPEPEELAQCEPFLQRQLQLLKPRIILAMGRFAIQALLRSNEPVGRLRGRVHSYQGIPLVVTYHPAYLLRNLPEKARAWDDLCLAADVFERLSPA